MHSSIFLNRAAGLLWLLLLGALPAILPARSYDYSTTDAMRRDTKFVVREMQGLHYSRKPLTEVNFTEFLNDYLSDLDYNRLYFLQEDIAHYHLRFTPEVLMGKFARGDLYPAFQIFKDYRSRALERIDWVFDRLEGDFDFSKEEAYILDRSEMEWPESRKEADAIWTRRLKYELLNELLTSVMETYEEKGPDTDANADPDVELSALTMKDLLNHSELAEKAEEARETIRRRYERWQKNLMDLEPSYIQERYLTTLTNLYDPHSTFLSADSLEDFSMAMNNSFVGIGAMLEDDDGYCTIRELLPGGPAEQSRLLESGDVILGVAQGKGDMVDVVDMNLRKIVKLIKGEKGSEVRLLIRPADTPDPSVRKVVSLIRDEIKLTANLASAKVFQVPSDKRTVSVGVIELPSFYGGTGEQVSEPTTDVEELIRKLKKYEVEGIILDLRRNGGGLLDEAVRLTGLFIPEGPVVQVRDYIGNIKSRADEDPKLIWDGPLMVLVSRFSASASEIVAGALQNHHRALIVGDSSTHGKGTVQAVVETDSRSLFPAFNSEPAGAIKVTIQKFYLPNGESTQKTGVVSDVIIPSVNEYLPVGEDDLDNALVWDTIQPIEWDNSTESDFAWVDPALVDSLAELSEKRQAALPEFDYLNKSIDYYRKIRNRESISLNIAERIQRKKSEKEFQEQMEKEMKALADSDYSDEEVLLDVRLEQEERSKDLAELSREEKSPLESDPDITPDREASLPESPDHEESSGEMTTSENEEMEAEEEADSNLDIQLRESLRIMRDWIALRSEATNPSAVTVQMKNPDRDAALTEVQ